MTGGQRPEEVHVAQKRLVVLTKHPPVRRAVEALGWHLEFGEPWHTAARKFDKTLPELKGTEEMHAAMREKMSGCSGTVEQTLQAGVAAREEVLGRNAREAHQAMMQAMGDNADHPLRLVATSGTDLKLNAADPDGDGDQRPIQAFSKQQPLRDLWSSGGDTHFLIARGEMPLFHLAVYLGSKETVETMLQTACTVEMLELRIGALRLSPTMLCLIGSHPDLIESSRLNHLPDMIRMTHVPDHAAVFRLLMDAGARPDSRDVTGKTIVHFATAKLATPATLAMADVCVERHDPASNGGVLLVNTQDRFGEVPLHGAIMAFTDVAMHWLCHKHGADVMVQDHSGTTPFSMNRLHPQTMAYISKSMAKNAKETAHSEKAQLVCSKCDAAQPLGGPALKLCSGCRCTRYCSAECQQAHWKKHKKACRERQQRKWRVKPAQAENMSSHGQVPLGPSWEGRLPKVAKAFGDEFDVKIQIGMQDTDPMMVYDKQRSFTLIVTAINCPVQYKDMFATVQAVGVAGRKGYFKATVPEPGGVMEIYPHTINVRSW